MQCWVTGSVVYTLPSSVPVHVPPTVSIGQRATLAAVGVQGGHVSVRTSVPARAIGSQVRVSGPSAVGVELGSGGSGQGTQVSVGSSASPSIQVDASPFVRRVSGQSDAVSSDSSVSMTLSNCDVRSALQSLFRHRKKDFEIDAKVQGLITCSVHNVTFDVALRSMLRAVGATYRIEDGIYIITPDTKTE